MKTNTATLQAYSQRGFGDRRTFHLGKPHAVAIATADASLASLIAAATAAADLAPAAAVFAGSGVSIKF